MAIEKLFAIGINTKDGVKFATKTSGHDIYSNKLDEAVLVDSAGFLLTCDEFFVPVKKNGHLVILEST